MKPRGLLLITLFSITCAAPATASLELGVPSTIALNLERERWSIGIGLDLFWNSSVVAVAPGDTVAFVVDDPAVFVLEPAAAARLFLTLDRELQPFLVVRAQRRVPIVNSDYEEIESELEDQWEGWRLGFGAGIRSRLNSRLALGGEGAVVADVQTLDDADTTVTGATTFMIFLQYTP